MPRVTGSKFEGKEDNDLFGNKKIISVGICDYSMRIKKIKKELSINAGGINIRTHFQFYHIYQFFKQNMQIIKTYVDNLKLQLDPKMYLDFIKNVHKVKSLNAEMRQAAMGKELSYNDFESYQVHSNQFD